MHWPLPGAVQCSVVFSIPKRNPRYFVRQENLVLLILLIKSPPVHLKNLNSVLV